MHNGLKTTDTPIRPAGMKDARPRPSILNYSQASERLYFKGNIRFFWEQESAWIARIDLAWIYLAATHFEKN